MQNKSKYHLVKVLRMRAKAEGHRVSLASIGKAANVSAATISKIEEGQIKKPRPDILDQTAQYFAEIFNEPITSNDLIDPNYIAREHEQTLRQYLEPKSAPVTERLASYLNKSLLASEQLVLQHQKPLSAYEQLAQLGKQYFSAIEQLASQGEQASSEKKSLSALESLAKDRPESDIFKASNTKLDILSPPQLVSIPVLKDVPAGNLDQVTEEHVMERVLFPATHLVGAKFALYAWADSMLPDIKNGDMLFIDPTVEPKEGDNIIAEVEGQITCRMMRTVNGQLLLMPANSDFSPIMVTGETTVNIIGKVVKLIRNC